MGAQIDNLRNWTKLAHERDGQLQIAQENVWHQGLLAQQQQDAAVQRVAALEDNAVLMRQQVAH